MKKKSFTASEIDALLSEHLQDLAKLIETEISQITGVKMAFSLCVFNYDNNSRMSYVSNIDRDTVAKIWLELIGAWSDGMPDIPAHKVQ